MDVIKSSVNTSDPEYQANYEAFKQRVEDLYARRARASVGGSQKARDLHKERGQLLPRERISAVLDPGSPFLELMQLAGEGMYEDVPPSGSMVTGVGLIHGRPVMLLVNDATIKGGCYYGVTCRKHVRAQKFAWQYRLPCITMVQSGGAFLPDMENIFPDDGMFGSIFYNQVRMSAEGIPQIAIVHGRSTAGGAYIPAICDEAVIIREQGAMYLGSPELVYAATGEQVDSESLGGAQMHCSVSGVTDHIAENDSHAMQATRNIVANLGTLPSVRWNVAEAKEPLYDPSEIYGIISRDPKHPTDMREILARLVDGSEFQEFKTLYGDTLICGFARIKGFEIGILANNGVMFTESATKGAHFMELCTKRDIPLLFIADVNGFMVGKEAEESGIAAAGARFITAMISANVPRYTLIAGGSYGAGYLAMCGRPMKPDAMLMWPTGRAAIMGPDQAATTLSLVRKAANERDGVTWTTEEEEAFKAPVRKTYEEFSDAYNFASKTWCDMVIEPVETRDTLAMLMEMAGRMPAKRTDFGVFRM